MLGLVSQLFVEIGISVRTHLILYGCGLREPGSPCPLIDEDFGHFHGWHWGHPASDAIDL
jgi:hypothetical protein